MIKTKEIKYHSKRRDALEMSAARVDWLICEVIDVLWCYHTKKTYESYQ